MRRVLIFVALVVMFGAVLIPASAAEQPDPEPQIGEPMPVVVGGPAAVSESTVLAIDALGWEAAWVYGADRYQTAAINAIEFYGGETSDYVFVATGQNFPDALAGGAHLWAKPLPNGSRRLEAVLPDRSECRGLDQFQAQGPA